MALIALASANATGAQSSFVNFESPHVHPIELSPNRTRLLAVNTPDDCLEVFDSLGNLLVHVESVPVGLDPVSVRTRTSTEAWVVNHLSDSISIVDLATNRVIRTIDTEDEPADVVFAGSPQRAFVTCSQVNKVLIYEIADLDAAPISIELRAEDPRALAVSPQGDKVYAAIFESGNRSSILGGGTTADGAYPPQVVNNPIGPYGGVNPPPNSGNSFVPPINPALPVLPPKVGLIIKQNDLEQWMDDNNGNWTDLVSGSQAPLSGRLTGWTLLDHDVAVIDVASLNVSYIDHLMNINMAMNVHPLTGEIVVVGTDATNEVRFEPNLNGTFVRVNLAHANPFTLTGAVQDLNPHLDYTTENLPFQVREQSIGDPRAIAYDEFGSRMFVAGMGSNNLLVLDQFGNRTGINPTIEVGEGPTGLAVDNVRERIYVLNRFESTISVIRLLDEVEISRVGFHDATPPVIKIGRKHLYSTHDNSGLGQASCASCHVDSRMDRLAWDLGDPTGDMKSVADQNLGAGIGVVSGEFDDFHPMKGPMLTQTLQDIIGKEPLHWRGDKDGLEEFAGAWTHLQGADNEPSAIDLQEFEDYLATIHFPPNPYRNLDNSLPANLPLPGMFTTGRFDPPGQPLPDGDPQLGLILYQPPFALGASSIPCATCHTFPVGIGTNDFFNGTQFVPLPPGPDGGLHHMLTRSDGNTNKTMKVPQLRNMHERTGFNTTQIESTAGFGFTHDGSADSLERFLSQPFFAVFNDQMVADLVALMLCFTGSELPLGDPLNLLMPPGPLSLDAHAAVGAQGTIFTDGTTSPPGLGLFTQLVAMANSGSIGLVAHATDADGPRGYTFLGAGVWQADRQSEVSNTSILWQSLPVGTEWTFLAVPKGSETRIGVDRDEDGHLNRDEIDAASDPADAASIPGPCSVAVPAAPNGLLIQVISSTVLRLTWNDNATNETGYVIERSKGTQGVFKEVAMLPAGARTFSDIGLDCGTRYEYRVRSRNCAGVSSAASAQRKTSSCLSLLADVSTISIATGGTQNLSLDASPLFAGKLYLVLGSLTGTAPGFALDGVNIPLNPDAYFGITLGNPNTPNFVNTLNFLDSDGRASAAIFMPQGLTPNLVGITVTHAYPVLDFPGGVGQVLFASNPTTFTFVP